MLPGSGVDETPGEGLVSLLSLRTSVQDKNKLKGFSGPKQKASWAHCTWDILLFTETIPSPILFHLLSKASS